MDKLLEILKQNSLLSLNNRYFDTIDAGLTCNQESEENQDLAYFDFLRTLKLGYLFANQLIDIPS